VKSFGTLMGHVVIVSLCALVAMVWNGLLVTTTYSINGVDIGRLSAAAIEEKLRIGGRILATVHVGPWIAFPLPALELGSLILPATAGLLLILAYGTGFIWPEARRLLVRLSIAGAFVVATLVMMRGL
jgi:hypothetical protein